MKLRPVLSAGAIGTLLAAANAVPAYAAPEDAPLEVSFAEAKVIADSDTADDLISNLGGDTDSITTGEDVSATDDATAIGHQDEPAIEYVLEPGDEEEFPAQGEGEEPKLLDTAEVPPVASPEEPVEADGTGEVAANDPIDEGVQDETEGVITSEPSDQAKDADPQTGGQAEADNDDDVATSPDTDAASDEITAEETEGDADIAAQATVAPPNGTNVSPQEVSASQSQSVTVAGAEALAQALIGANIEILNVTYTGHSQSAGLFSGFGDAIGIESGVILSTGYADHLYNSDGVLLNRAVLYGPNTDDATTGNMNTPGDDALAALIDGTTYDGAILEIEFIPTYDTVAFNYVFGSEEYLEYVGTQFNDVFAFFVNGINYATLDDGTVVAINNINHETNSEFFRNNPHDADGNSPFDTGLDGMTIVLGFDAPVNPGVANILRLAIADVGDSSWDSAVMIQSGSFTSPEVNTPPVADNKAVETDFNTPVVIVLTGSDADGDELTFEIVNTADLAGSLSIDGANIIFIPTAGFFGETFFTYVASDGQVNSPEATVVIVVANDDPSEPGQPTDPTDPEEPTDPTDPEEPTAPTDTSDAAGPGAPSGPITQVGGQPIDQDARVGALHVTPQSDAESATSSLPWDQPLGVQSADQPGESTEHGLATTGAVSTTLAIGGTMLIAAGAVLLLWRRRANS